MSTKRDAADLHVRVCEEADAVLDLMAAAQCKARNAIAAEIIERALLGEGHNLRVAAMRYARMGLDGTGRDLK